MASRGDRRSGGWGGGYKRRDKRRDGQMACLCCAERAREGEGARLCCTHKQREGEEERRVRSVHVFMHAFLYACVYAYDGCACTYVCMFACMHVNIHTHTYTYFHAERDTTQVTIETTKCEKLKRKRDRMRLSIYLPHVPVYLSTMCTFIYSVYLSTNCLSQARHMGSDEYASTHAGARRYMGPEAHGLATREHRHARRTSETVAGLRLVPP